MLGADGVAFNVNVILVSTSVCAVMSGVPLDVNVRLYVPVLFPAKLRSKTAPILPALLPFSVTAVLPAPSAKL